MAVDGQAKKDLTLELLDEVMQIAKKSNDKWIVACESDPEFVDNLNKIYYSGVGNADDDGGDGAA